MQQNPFNQNPLTRNKVLPTVTFVSPDKAKDLSVPKSTFSYEEMMEQYKNMSVPNQLPDPTKSASGGLVQYDKSPLTKDEWTKWRFHVRKSEHGDWGDAWGKEEVAKEQQIDKKSQEYTQRSRIENAKLSADLEKDEFRKQLLADIDSGNLFPNTRLEEVDESKRSNVSQTTIKENKDGSDSKQ